MKDLIRIRTAVSRSDKDALLEDLLPLEWEGGPVEYEPVEGSQIQVEWYVADPAQAEAIRGVLEKDFRTAEVGVEPLTQQDWNTYWRSHFSTQRVGKHWLLIPEWEQGAVEIAYEDRPMILRPGLGFGTGDHFTTRYCLEAMEAYGQGASSMLDAGTGSGILSVGARLLGIPRVIAFDCDSDALACARDNLALNGIVQGVDLHPWELDDLPETSAQIVCANLYDTLLIRYAEILCRSVEDLLILSGIRRAQKERVYEAYEEHGFQCLHQDQNEEWAGLTFRSPSSKA